MRQLTEILEPGMNIADLIIRIRTDFKFFFERVLGFDMKGGLNEYKLEWFNLAYDNDYVMIKAPSGFAKTIVLGVSFSIWWALTHEKSRVLLISKTLSQSKISLLMEVRDLIDENEFLKKIMKPESRDNVWSQTMLKTKNGSVIFNRPYTIALKGSRGDIVILDEIDSYDDYSIFFDHVLSRLKPGGKVIGISTPEAGTGTVMSMIEFRESAEGHDPDIPPCIMKTYTAVKNYSDYSNPLADGESIWPEEFPIRELKIRLKRFGREMWYKNYLCDTTTESEDSIFKASDIRKCIDAGKGLKYNSKRLGGEIYIGCDFAISDAPTGDYDAYVVIEKIKDTAYIKFAETIKGLPVEGKVKKMENLMKKYNPNFFICDESNFGIEVIRQARNKGIPIVAQSFQSHERSILLSNLISLISNHKIVIPKHPDDLQAIEFADKLEDELLGFVEKKNETTGFKSLVSKKMHDDSVMGLSMACKHVKIMEDFEDEIGVSNGGEDEAPDLSENITTQVKEPKGSGYLRIRE